MTQNGSIERSAATAVQAPTPEGPPVRLLHICAGNLYGGVEAMLMTFVSAEGAEPLLSHEFCVCFEGRFSENLTKAGLRPHHLGETRLSRPWTVLRARRRLRRFLLVSGPYDFVVCHSAWTMAVFGRSLHATNAGELIFWLHGAPDGKQWLERLARKVRPALAICNSRFTGELLPHLYPNLRPAIVYCPVAPPESVVSRRDCRAAIGTEPAVPVILLLARMEDRKGHRYLVEALSRVQHLEWECWIVGGPQRPSEFAYLRALRTRVDGLGLNGRVRFLGERTDVGDLLHASDILCHPHITPEPFGIAIVEAMSSGLIVVASNIGGPREVLTKESGLLVCPADAAGLASAIENVLDLPEEQRSRMAKAARERASELCAPTTAVTQLNDVLRLRRSLTAVPHQKVQPFWACLAKDLLAHIPVQRRRDGRRSRTVQYLRTVALSAGFHLTLLYRAAHALRDHFGAFGRALAFLLYWVTRHWYGCTISPKARLGGGLILPHPQGIVIGPDVTVGDRAWIYQNVTLGGGNHSGMPTIGDDARIYTGAVVAGGVRLGDRVSIGANSVVTFDVPDGARVRQPEPVMRLDRTHE